MACKRAVPDYELVLERMILPGQCCVVDALKLCDFVMRYTNLFFCIRLES